jgi:hypothetical protein
MTNTGHSRIPLLLKGAQIKTAALSAAFVGRRLGTPADTRLLGAMLTRELAKDGAGLLQRDLDAMLGEAR